MWIFFGLSFGFFKNYFGMYVTARRFRVFNTTEEMLFFRTGLLQCSILPQFQMYRKFIHFFAILFPHLCMYLEDSELSIP